MEDFICIYCLKLCKNLNSLTQHLIRCKLNPYRLDISMKNYPMSKCDICGKLYRNCDISKHIRRHENHPESFVHITYKSNHEGLTCQFCGKECKNRNSLSNHERLCKLNSDRQESSFVKYNELIRSGEKTTWNKGLTKETDKRVKQCTDTFNLNEKLGLHDKSYITDEYRLKHRELALLQGFGGHFYKNQIEYKGIKLDSSYELALAKNLDENNVRWERPDRLPYHIDDKLHYYIPDFYLPDYDVYLDPKNDFLIENVNPTMGYKDIDKIKLVEIGNNVKIIILDKNLLTFDSVLTMII